MIKKSITVFLLILAAGCIQQDGHMEGPMGAPSLEELRAEFESNGEMIFFTGSNEKGEQISFEGGPGWVYMHGGACVTCHGAEGKGGEVPHMCSVEAASISYHDLTEEEHGEHAEEEEEPHPPYTDETIKQAIKEGLNPAGEELDLCMPRWEMSDKDMADVIEYLKTL
jgi:mono/diheme cytochrome c family protein